MSTETEQERAAADAPSAVPGTVELVGGHGLIALCNPYRLDGRVSTHPVTTRGWAPMNVYVLRQDDHLLIIDSGMTVHRSAILEQLETLVNERTQLAFLPWRYGELNPLCNYGAIADRFGVARVIGDYFGHPGEWLDFLPGSIGIEAIGQATVESFPTTGEIRVDPSHPRSVATFAPPIWLIPHAWGYDAQTRTLFTADMFTWVHRETSQGPWVVTSQMDRTSADEVWDSLRTNMYWWLPNASTDTMRRDLEATFERFDVETIAPGYGCILNGRDVVERHVQLLDDALARAPRAQAQGVAVGSWRYDKGMLS